MYDTNNDHPVFYQRETFRVASLPSGRKGLLRIAKDSQDHSLGVVLDEETPFYGLFVEEDDIVGDKAHESEKRIDAKLKTLNCEYEAKRDSGRLGTVRLQPMPMGSDRWDAERLLKKGGSADHYKHPCLLVDLDEVHELPVVDHALLTESDTSRN